MKNKIIALSALLGAHLTTATAAIVVVAPTASTPGSFEITEDITFTITASGAVSFFAFDNWVTTPDPQTSVSFSPTLSLSLNGGAFTEGGAFYDNVGFPIGNLTANDGFIYINSPLSVVAGDTVTLKAGSYSLPLNSGFNPLVTQTFTGDMFLTNGSGVRLSENTPAAIPEPSSAALLFGVVSAFAMARRRSRKA